MKKEKIGEVNFGKFKTEFSLTPKVKEYLEDGQVSLATLLPNGWEWYEAELFDMIDDNQTMEPNKKYGKSFEVIYYGIIESRDLVEKKWDKEDLKIKEKGFSEDLEGLDEDKNFIGDVTMDINSTPKNPDKKFKIKYIVRKI